MNRIKREVNSIYFLIYPSYLEINMAAKYAIKINKKGTHISATYDNIIKTDRRTVIGNDNIEIHTIEHLMAALYMKNITNIVVEMDNFEPPILDGSSAGFVEAISKVGVKKQNSEILPIIIIVLVLPSRN